MKHLLKSLQRHANTGLVEDTISNLQRVPQLDKQIWTSIFLNISYDGQSVINYSSQDFNLRFLINIYCPGFVFRDHIIPEFRHILKMSAGRWPITNTLVASFPKTTLKSLDFRFRFDSSPLKASMLG
ncbi:hypothetical protein AVEN_48616-1 [Araneus ventricosus]|uniref:Uncharacterized protein n=1 Tax=Araneus ventricosus TaxID=182803 RepID=A0A4Y2VLC3_ARAVE|nr:hypothetical protein AVEN_48616-1 [Araneus ventricosus]